METTRHFTATVYIVNDGATALHDHERLGLLLPPGGHLGRDELPHEAALREVREETGLDATLLADYEDVRSETARTIPHPRHLHLADVNACDGQVGHQHIDHVYYATVDSRDVDPADGEEGPEAWEWYTPVDLRESGADPDVVTFGVEAITAAEER